MATAPIQYDLQIANGANAAYAGTPGPAQAAAAGDYKQNTQGLRRIRWVLEDFKRGPIDVPRW